MIVHAPISIGELYDKLSILKIKQNYIKDPNKIENINKEYNLLKKLVLEAGKTLNDVDKLKAGKLFADLIFINNQLWGIEDDIRKMDKPVFDKYLEEGVSPFSDETFQENLGIYLNLARSVYITNDKRFNAKKQINELFNSEIVEEKGYQEY